TKVSCIGSEAHPPFALAKETLGQPAAAALNQQRADQECLQTAQGDRGNNKPVIAFPISRLSEPDDAAGRQALLAHAPSPKLAPIKHRRRLMRLGPGGGLRFVTGEDAHPQSSCFAADPLKRDHRAANDPVSEVSVVAAVDGSTAGRSKRRQ